MMSPTVRLVLRATVAAAAMLTASLAPLTVRATLITVTNTSDAGAGSLRQAVLEANAIAGLDEIDFDAGLSGSTIGLTSGTLFVTDDLKIVGPRADLLTVSGPGQHNPSSFTIFDIAPDTIAQISGLTVTGGRGSSSFSPYGEVAGGIFNAGTLSLSDSIISDNAATDGDGGGIFNLGTLTVRESTITRNFSGSIGGHR